MPISMNVGRRDVARAITPSETHVISTGTLHLHGLEDGELRSWPDHHLATLNEETGLIMVHGDLGSYVHSWPPSHRPGRTLHEFLAEMTFDQFMTKASTTPHMRADIAATVATMRRELIAERRADTISRTDARNLWTLIADDLEHLDDENAFIEAIWRDRDLTRHYYDGDPPYVARVPKEIAVRFWKEVWETLRRDVLLPAVRARREETSQAA